MKIYVIAAMHGDETFGLKVAGILLQNKHDNIAVRIGHPEAIAKKTRYIETDLNRSFSTSAKSKESQLAKVILAEIKSFAPDCIIDIHTSVSNVKKVAIVAQSNKMVKSIAEHLGMDAVVVMSKSIAKDSLIGCYPDKAVSIEFGRYQRSDSLAKYLAEQIITISKDVIHSSSRLPIYKVSGIIPKQYPGLGAVVNLEYDDLLKGYPFLAGKNTYPTIGGFLAQKLLK